MTTLTTAELEECYDAAVTTEEACRTILEALQTPENAGDEPSKAEREAEVSLAKAVSAVARLDAALSVARQRDAVATRTAAAREVETADILTGKALSDVQDAADAVTKTVERYVKEYARLTRAWSVAQGRVSYNPRLRHGAALPNPEHAVADELARISVTLGDGILPPGASARTVQYGDVHTAPALSETFATHTRAYIADLARDRGVPDPTPPIAATPPSSAPEPVWDEADEEAAAA